MHVTVREVIRHFLHVSGSNFVLDHIRTRRGQNITHLSKTDRGEIFSQIYSDGIWMSNATTGARSGQGSELVATRTVRTELGESLRQHAVTSLLDVGCGDFTWMQHVDLAGISYTGVDIVPSVLAASMEQRSGPGRHFELLDAVEGPLPYADAVLCREVLFHLSLNDAIAVLANVRKSGALILVATSDASTQYNADIRTGDFRVLNLRRRPFRFPAPLAIIPDSAVTGGRHLGLWRIADLPQ